MDAGVCAFERLNPGAELLAVPMHRLPGRSIWAAREHRDAMAALLKELRQHAANLAAAAGKNDTERPACWDS